MQEEHVVQEKFTTAREATPAGARAPRGLRVVGLCALVVAIAVVVFGIVERRQNEVTVAQWTEAQAIPEVAILTPKSSPAVAPWFCRATSRRGTRRRCTPASAAI